MYPNPYGRMKPEDKIEATTLRNLGKTSEFMIAINTPTGKLLFDDLILLLDEKFKLIYEEKASERDKAIFSACKYIGNRWNSLIESHEKNVVEYQRIQDRKNKKQLKDK